MLCVLKPKKTDSQERTSFTEITLILTRQTVTDFVL